MNTNIDILQSFKLNYIEDNVIYIIYIYIYIYMRMLLYLRKTKKLY